MAEAVPQGILGLTPAELNNLSDAELHAIMTEFGIRVPFEQLITDAQTYVAQMSNRLIPGSPQFNAEVERITGPASRRGLLGMARRTQENASTLEILERSGTTELIRVLDSDENNCDNCIALAGEIGTLEYHQSIGMPGAASCLGGDYCRCQLMPFG
jgi:hypothetical protein